MRRIPFGLDVATLPEVMIDLALEYWWITCIAAILTVGAVVGMIIFTKKSKENKK